mmetsp:Transcript_31001/g.62587  ORF Transcript_31001/g.62587 Transcript_31001/m.62587 type:complete len:166 (+) Transcript_31001:113-610(+)
MEPPNHGNLLQAERPSRTTTMNQLNCFAFTDSPSNKTRITKRPKKNSVTDYVALTITSFPNEELSIPITALRHHPPMHKESEPSKQSHTEVLYHTQTLFNLSRYIFGSLPDSNIFHPSCTVAQLAFVSDEAFVGQFELLPPPSLLLPPLPPLQLPRLTRCRRCCQ